MQLILDESYEQDESESESDDAFETAQELDSDEIADDDDDEQAEEQWDGAGEEVEFSQDEEPSSDESEEELPPVKVPAGKRKRLSEASVAPPTAKRSKKAVTFVNGDVEKPGFDERKVGASAKLKRKADEDESSNRKKSKAERDVEPEARVVKAAPSKPAKAPKEKKIQAKPAAEPVKVAKGKAAKSGDDAEKPYDFGAHFF